MGVMVNFQKFGTPGILGRSILRFWEMRQNRRFPSTIKFQTNTVPSQFPYGIRYLPVARLRNNCSDLNNDLFSQSYNLVIIVVPIVTKVRMPNIISSDVQDTVLNGFTFYTLRDFHPLNCHLLLRGNPALSSELNFLILPLFTAEACEESSRWLWKEKLC